MTTGASRRPNDGWVASLLPTMLAWSAGRVGSATSELKSGTNVDTVGSAATSVTSLRSDENFTESACPMSNKAMIPKHPAESTARKLKGAEPTDELLHLASNLALNNTPSLLPFERDAKSDVSFDRSEEARSAIAGRYTGGGNRTQVECRSTELSTLLTPTNVRRWDRQLLQEQLLELELDGLQLS